MNVRRIGKAGQPVKDFDSIARELRANDIDFGFDDVLRAKGKIGHADLILHTVVYAVNILVIEAREMQHRFANGFTGNRSSIDGRATDDFQLFDQRHALAKFRCLNRRALARRPRANDNEIVLFHSGTSIEAESISPLNYWNCKTRFTTSARRAARRIPP